MAALDEFDRNVRENGILIDTNLLVMLVVGSVHRDRISRFKRATGYSAADWDLLIGILEQISKSYTLPHLLAEASALTYLKGPELEVARTMLIRFIGNCAKVRDDDNTSTWVTSWWPVKRTESVVCAGMKGENLVCHVRVGRSTFN